MAIKPKAGEVWSSTTEARAGVKAVSTYCFVVEEDGKLLGIWLSVSWKPVSMDDVEDEKDNWKKVYEPKHIEATSFA